jgi:hypothetical protein
MENKNKILWDDVIENNAISIGEKAKGYKIMHMKSSRHISKIYNILMYSGIVLGPLSGLLSGIGTIINPETDITIPLIASCVGFVSGILVATTKFGKFEQKSSAHKIAASKYTSLESNIRRQLAIPKKARINPVEYMEYIGNSFDELFLASPLINSDIYNNYVKVAKKHGINVPDEYKITINISDKFQTEKLAELKDVSNIKSNNSEENNTKSSSEEEIHKLNRQSTKIKGKNNIRRSTNMCNFNDINTFSDGKMDYELKRMMGFK